MTQPPGGTSKCAKCSRPIRPETARENHCPECSASYCHSHYTWSDWKMVHQTRDEMFRTGECPEGHRKQEVDRD